MGRLLRHGAFLALSAGVCVDTENVGRCAFPMN